MMFALFARRSTRFKIFAAIFIFGLTISFMGTFGSYLLRIKHLQDGLMSFINSELDISVSRLYRDLADMRNIIANLADVEAGGYYDDMSADIKARGDEAVKSYMVSIGRSFGNMMQFRLIDADGMEKIRVERKKAGDVLEIVPDRQLQNKADRYYFKQGMQMPAGQIWISDLDLNVEYGSIEVPYRPTIRMTSPYMKNGDKRGLLVINYFADSILYNFLAVENTDVYLADKEGRYIYHPDPAKRFSKDRHLNTNIFNDFKFMETTESGGYYFDGKKTLAKKISLSAESYFYVLYQIKKSYLRSIHAQQFFLSLGLYAVSGLFALLVSFYVSKFSAERYESKVSEAESAASHNRAMRKKMVELEVKSNIDPLTGVFNRRFFEAKLQELTEKETLYTLIVFDIDHFKMVNDDFGHDIGDKVLKELANIIRANTRDTDFLTRWGGEEFVLTLFDITEETAERLGEKFRRLVENNNFGLDRVVTCSFGISKRKPGESAETVFKRADEALYKAKNTGRNRVVLGI